METPTSEVEVQRSIANFPAGLWEDLGASFLVSDSWQGKTDAYREKQIDLRKHVEDSFIASKANPIENIKFIDTLCRLGVSYHFAKEIEEQLETIYAKYKIYELIRSNELDLDSTGLVFQVLRQYGFKLPADVFNKFKDEDGNFKKHLGEDARGMLSLYEAAQWSTHGEDILDEALDFSRSCLEELVHQSSPHLKVRIMNALKHPYHKGLTRIEARQYITYYEQEETHDETLLQFAKVDFNILQLLHCEEIVQFSRWFKDLKIDSKLPYARDRMVEAYLWGLAIYFEPEYSRGRIVFASVIVFISLIDDTYDAFATVEELNIFTDALDRWLPASPDGIPESMKYLYGIILDFFNKLEDEMEEEGRSGCGFHLKNALKVLAMTYYQEAKWANNDYVATFEEYKENGKRTSSYVVLSTASLVGMTDTAKLDTFKWLTSYPKILVASEIIGRFMNDIVSSEFEYERRHHATALDCYMKQYSVSKDKAKKDVQHIISESWKDINEELMRPHSVPFPILMRLLNITRITEITYKFHDAYTNSKHYKDYVISLLSENIPS